MKRIKSTKRIRGFAILTALLMIFLISSCMSQSEESPAAKKVEETDSDRDTPQFAVILPNLEHGDPMSDDIMIGINRIAREVGGTIYGRAETIVFGYAADFTIHSTSDNYDEIVNYLRVLNPERFDVVVCAGFPYAGPLYEIQKEYPETFFVGIDFVHNFPNESNALSLAWHMADTTFIAGAVAAERFGNGTIGVIGGKDLEFINTEFVGGFVDGAAYMDQLKGTQTEVLVDYVGSFSDYEGGYSLASAMFENGAECIFQAAGRAGDGVIDAAGDLGKMVIGVDTDQGLEAALNGDPSDHLLTSAVKKWGHSVYLVCREFLMTGQLPGGIRTVGLVEECSDIAVNPYNAPILGDQLNTIEGLKETFLAGEVPSAVSDSDRLQWTAAEPPSSAMIITVNEPAVSPGMPENYAGALQQALSTELYGSGRYHVIDREQVDRLLSEMVFALDGITEENTQLEVGRLAAAEAIVFVTLAELGQKINLDCKLVDVETGLTLAASREDYDDFETLIENLKIFVDRF